MKKDFYDMQTGYIYRQHKGCIPIVRVWTGAMLSDLRRWYATSTNAELADLLGVSERTVQRKAAALGLKKDTGWLYGLRRQAIRYAGVCSRRLGYPGHFQPGNTIGQSHWFKPAATVKA